jgi:hypothetical protein
MNCPGGSSRTIEAISNPLSSLPGGQPKAFLVEGQGSVVTVRPVVRARQPRKGGGQRGPIGQFSRQSRRNLAIGVHTVGWEGIAPERIYEIRCTVPFGFDSSEKNNSRYLDALRRKLFRHFGKDGSAGLWKREFGKKGEEHMHAIVVVCRIPKRQARRYGIDVSDLPPAQFKRDLERLVRAMWARILGYKPADCPTDLVHCERVRSTECCTNYFVKGPGSGRKGYETRIPAGTTRDGRWWGFWGYRLIAAPKTAVRLEPAEFYNVRRTLRKVGEKRQRGAWRAPIFSPTSGIRMVTAQPSGKAYDRLVRLVEEGRNNRYANRYARRIPRDVRSAAAWMPTPVLRSEVMPLRDIERPCVAATCVEGGDS